MCAMTENTQWIDIAGRGGSMRSALARGGFPDTLKDFGETLTMLTK